MILSELIKIGINILSKNIHIDNPQLEVDLILSYLLKIPYYEICFHQNTTISPALISSFKRLLNQRKKNMPLQYILGYTEFFGIKLFISKDVFIPRPETEILVEKTLQIISFLQEQDVKDIKMLDIGTGSGCIPLAVLKNTSNVICFANDISYPAIKNAKRNFLYHRLQNSIHLFLSDIFSAVSFYKKFDIITCNPPYISFQEKNTLPPDVYDYEPHIGLFADDNGLAFIKRLAYESHRYLSPGGVLLMEIGYNQKDNVKEILDSIGFFANINFLKDLNGIDRVVCSQFKI